MKTCGIIVEYNPLHYGHIHHIKESRNKSQCDCLIAIMSGNFVQRGEMAIVDKWTRAKEAIKHGVDLVVELPYPFATSSADYFAKGGVELLKLLKVDQMIFGSESNDLAKLEALIDKKSLGDFHHSYAYNFFKQYPLLSNDLLGLCYIKELQNSNIKYDCIKRNNNYFDSSMDQNIASASAIRQAIINHQPYEHTTPMQPLDDTFQWENYYALLQYLLMSIDEDTLSNIYLVHEGIHLLFKKQAYLHDNYEDFIRACTSKRYPRSKLQRILVQILNQCLKSDIESSSNSSRSQE